MKVLIDTSIWSLALRRRVKALSTTEQKRLKELIELINEARAIIIGPIRQEILSGISEKNQYLELKEKLSPFEDFKIQTAEYELAADYFNRCRKKGIQGSHTDFLICAVASNNEFPIFTLDNDFIRYSKHCKIKIHKSRFDKK